MHQICLRFARSSAIGGEPLRFRGDVFHAYHFNCAGCGEELTSSAREVKVRKPSDAYGPVQCPLSPVRLCQLRSRTSSFAYGVTTIWASRSAARAGGPSRSASSRRWARTGTDPYAAVCCPSPYSTSRENVISENCPFNS